MDKESKTDFSFLKRKDFIAVGIFSLMMLLYYPFGIARAAFYGNPLRNWSLLEGFTWEIIGYFALAMTALKADRLFAFLKKNIAVAVCSTLYIIVLLLQQFLIFPSLYNLGSGISYIALIAVGFLYREEWKKIMPVLFLIFFVSSIAMNIHDLIYQNTAGLTGNWNWSSTLTMISGVSIFFIFGNKLPAFERKWGIYFAILTIILLVYLYFIGHFPKGTILSGIIGLCVLFWCYLDYFMSKKTRYILAVSAVVLFGLAAIWQKDFISAQLKNDTRIYLWENGLKVIAGNPLLGCEYGRYMTVSADKMSPEYFLTGNAALIHNHPHNEFLFHLANFGISGILLSVLMLFSLLKAIQQFERRKDFCNGFFLFVYAALLIHSMLDVTLMHWPCNIIFYLLAGSLPAMQLELTENAAVKKIYMVVPAIFFALLGSFLLAKNFMASMYYRQAVTLGKNYQKRLQVSRKSFAFRPTFKTVNDIAILSNSPDESLLLLLDMHKLTGIENYSHSNLTTANLFMQMKMPEQALKFFEKEYQCFPLSVRNLYFFRNALMQLKRKKEAISVEKMIFEIIKLKNLDKRHINILIRYPEYDLNSNRIPENLLNLKRK